MLSKYVWNNIEQENYLCNIAPERIDMFLQGNNLHNIVLVCWNICRMQAMFSHCP